MADRNKSAHTIHPLVRLDMAAVCVVWTDVPDRPIRLELGSGPSRPRWRLEVFRLRPVGLLSDRFRLGRGSGWWSRESHSSGRLALRLWIFRVRSSSIRPRFVCRAISRIYARAARVEAPGNR